MGHLLHLPVLMLLSGLTFLSWQGEVVSNSWFPVFLTLTILYIAALLWMVNAIDEQDKEEYKEAAARMKQRQSQSWVDLFARHDGLVQQFANILIDEKTRILYPELLKTDNDLARSIEQEQSLALALRPNTPSDQEYVENSAYFRAVERLEAAIKAFIESAKKTGWDNLTPEESLKRSLALEEYYKRQEANNLPLRGTTYSLMS